MKNALVFLVSVVFSIALGELILRAFTDFPVSTSSNKVDDPQLGYRLSPSLDDVDADGFRNPDGKSESFRVAAIGDSHTYGNNVRSNDAWPAVFERQTGMSTYNYGVGSYGIAAYHVVVGRILQTEADTILIALYPANDFIEKYPYCGVRGADFEYWKRQIAEIGVIAPENAEQCPEEKAGGMIEALGEGITDTLKDNLAVVSAVEYLVVNPLRDNLARAGSESGETDHRRFGFPAGLASIQRSRVRKHAISSDLDRPGIRRMFGNFEKFARNWQSTARGKGVALGILLVPSRERSVHALLERRGLLDQADPEFRRLVGFQVRLEHAVTTALDTIGIPFQLATDDVIGALETAAAEGRSIYPYHDDGHPYEEGYQAYANAAERLWRAIDAQAQ